MNSDMYIEFVLVFRFSVLHPTVLFLVACFKFVYCCADIPQPTLPAWLSHHILPFWYQGQGPRKEVPVVRRHGGKIHCSPSSRVLVTRLFGKCWNGMLLAYCPSHKSELPVFFFLSFGLCYELYIDRCYSEPNSLWTVTWEFAPLFGNSNLNGLCCTCQVSKASLSGSVIDIVIKTENLRTVSVECHSDDTPLIFHDTSLSPLLILLVYVNKFNLHNTSITLPLRLA